MSTLMPTRVADLVDIVAEARSDRAPLEVTGTGAKPGLGRVMQTARSVSAAGLDGITLYEPAEMVIGARAGTPLDAVAAVLDEKGQVLPFEPRRLGGFYGSGSSGTIGAVAAANLSGPKRVHAGAARDHLIGISMVTGRAEEVSSGGRVMKNVTGYDLVKLAAGSFGTLGILTEVIFKVLPKPETETTLVFNGLDDRRAVALLCAAMRTPYEVTGAAHLPARDGDGARTLVRIEGFAFSVDYRRGELTAELREHGAPEVLDAPASRAAWRAIADLDLFAPRSGPDDRAIWQISTAPTRGPDVADRLRGATDVEIAYDWSGGLVLAATPATEAAGGAVAAAVEGAGGHATLLRGPAGLRGHVDVFQGPAAPVLDMTRRVKAAFDPDGVLNPGKMYQGV